jgi:hypothetical protein
VWPKGKGFGGSVAATFGLSHQTKSLSPFPRRNA